MLTIAAATQPGGDSNVQVIVNTMAAAHWDEVDLAFAYATTSGARLLITRAQAGASNTWTSSQKRWLVGFDYLRSDPLALRTLRELPNSSVRVPNAHQVLASQACTPATPFHPKTIIYRRTGHAALFAGSGNLSRSGLLSGHELGVLIGSVPPRKAADGSHMVAATAAADWFNALWQTSTPLTAALLEAYDAVYQSVSNLEHPTPTDDDAPVQPRPGRTLTTLDLRKLRACKHYWIEALNITRNRGPHLPGNQLMMTPLTRVFFGVPAVGVPQNTALRHVQVQYDNLPAVEGSLTFSDNGMDKITLPVPGVSGPPQYDDRNLLFTRLGPSLFRLQLGTAAEKREWIRRSTAIEALHVMRPLGRRWGVF